MSARKFSVGQVVYIFTRDDGKLTPALITEEIIRRTVAGIKSSYLVQVGNEKPVDVSKITNELFASSAEATQVLTDRTLTAIKKLIDGAVASAARLYPQAMGNKDVSDAADEVEQPEETPGDYQLVELPDGTIAKFKPPTT